MVRLELQDLRDARPRRCEVAELGVGRGEVDERVGIRGVELRDPLELDARRLVVLAATGGHAELEVRQHEVRGCRRVRELLQRRLAARVAHVEQGERARELDAHFA